MAAGGDFAILSVARDVFVVFLAFLLDLVGVEGSEAMVASGTAVASDPLGELLSEIAAAITSSSGVFAAILGSAPFFLRCTAVCAKNNG